MRIASINKPVSVAKKPTFDQNFYSEFDRAKNIDDLKNRILKAVNGLGFSDFMFLHAEGKCLSEQNFLLTYPDEFLRQYQEEGLSTDDMIIEYARENTRPIFSSQVYGYFYDAIFDTKVIRVNRAIRQLNFAFGFFDNYVVPIASHDDSGKLLFAVSQRHAKADEFRTEANSLAVPLQSLGQTINSVVHDKFPNYFVNAEEYRKKNSGVHITPKQLLVLDTLANHDLSINEVADKLFISPITSHQHITSARKALSAKTNICAIRKAINLGLIRYRNDEQD